MSEFRPLENENAVIALETGTFKYSLLLSLLVQGMTSSSMISNLASYIDRQRKGTISSDEDIFLDGVEAEILEPGDSHWKKGKIKLRFVIDFCPDQVEAPQHPAIDSPLDKIRQMTVE